MAIDMRIVVISAREGGGGWNGMREPSCAVEVFKILVVMIAWVCILSNFIKI